MASPTLQLQIAFATLDPFSTSPTWSNVSVDLLEASVSRGRQRELDRCDAGQGTFVLENTSWQYVFGYTSAANNPNVLPLKRIQLNVTVSGKVYPLFTGWIDRWEIDWTSAAYSTVKVGATDALGLFATTPLIGAFPQQKASARVASILLNIQWPTALTAISTGPRSCPAKTFVSTDGQTALAALNQTADSDPGTLFVDGSGTVNYYSGFVGGAMPAPLGDNPDLGEVQLDSAVLSLADDVIWNDLRGRRDNGTGEVRLTSSSSQGEFRYRTTSKSTYNVNDTDLTAAMQSFLNRYQYPTQLFDPVTVMPTGDLLSAYAWCCQAEIGKAVTVYRTPPASLGLPRFQQTCVINHVQHDIKTGAGGDWTTTLRLAGANLH